MSQPAIHREEQEELPSEFGVTLADAGRMMRKAKCVWILFRVGPAEQTAIFAVPKSTVLKEIEFYQGGKKTFRPSELDFNTHDGPTLIFGGCRAIDRAAASRHAEMAT